MTILKWTLLTIVGLYLAALIVVYFSQRKFIYFPQIPEQISEAEKPEYAERFGFEIAEVNVGGVGAIKSYYAGPQPGKPVLIFFHGNASAAHQTLGGFRKLQQAGWGVLSAEYPGYENNPGSPSESAFLANAEAHFLWVRETGGDRSIIVMGESLGSGSAVHVASTHQVDGLVLTAAFYSLQAVAQKTMPMFPAKLLTKDKFRSDLKMPGVKAPLLSFHGTLDNVIPFEMGQALSQLHAGNKVFMPVPNGGHMLWGYDLPAHILDWAETTGISTAQ